PPPASGMLKRAYLGDTSPPSPPFSSHPMSVSAPPLTLTKTPISWLTPVRFVQRSAFPEMIAADFRAGLNVRERRDGSMSVHVSPSPLGSWYWRVLTALYGLTTGAVVGTGDAGGAPVGDGDGVGGSVAGGRGFLRGGAAGVGG